MEIYVHIPFCMRKCLYCDFFSLSDTLNADRDRYFEDLKQEILSQSDVKKKITSVFFGGGTPSSVDPYLITDILNLLHSQFDISEDAEITIEANPGTLTLEKLKLYRKAGFNRLSLGLQSSDDKMLKKLGRIHSFSDFKTGFYLARDTGFTNISVDLISGIPLETADIFENSLKKVLSLQPEHISVYSLIVEENTPFYTLYGPDGSLTCELPSEEEDRKLVALTRKILKENGYKHYEISNYAKPGFESRHNIGYWTQEEYLGFGAAAASFVSNVRKKNAENLNYRNLPYSEIEVLSKEDLMSEFMILGLRMTEGVCDSKFREKYGLSFFDVYGNVLNKYLSYGVIEKEGEIIRLTERGEDVCNLLFEELL